MPELESPEPITEEKYEFDKPVQQEILGLMLRNKYFLIQSLQLISPNYFVDKAHILVCKILFQYFQEYKELPQKHYIEEEIKSQLQGNPTVLYYLAEFHSVLKAYVPGLESRNYLLTKVTEFAKQQSLKIAIGQSVELVKKNVDSKWDKIQELLKQAFLVSPNLNLGQYYFESIEERYQRLEEEKNNSQKTKFTSGFSEIDFWFSDDISGGLSRGEIGAYMGMPGTGKSIALVQAGYRNLLRGHKVLYVSLEMDEDKVAQRFDAMLTQIPINELHARKNEVITKLNETLQGLNTGALDQRRLIIKQFPAGTADVNTLRAYHSQLQLHGFKPDLVIVDYVGEFRDIPGIKTYESRQRLVRDLRGFSVEEGHCTLTAFQPNRSGRLQQEEGNCIDDSELGDSFGQARPMDAIWSINQNRVEKKQKVGRIFVVKHRSGKSREQLWFKQDQNTLEMHPITHHTYLAELSKYAPETVEQVQINKFEGKNLKANQ